MLEIFTQHSVSNKPSHQLEELRKPAVTMGGPGADDPMAGMLQQILGETSAEQKARIAEATKGANDLSGLVKKKKAKPAATGAGASATATTSNGKRKLDDEEAAGDGKRAKTEELLDAA